MLRRVLLGLLVLVVLAGIVAGYFYFQYLNRPDATAQKTAETFVTSLAKGDFDTAYNLTTDNVKRSWNNGRTAVALLEPFAGGRPEFVRSTPLEDNSYRPEDQVQRFVYNFYFAADENAGRHYELQLNLIAIDEEHWRVDYFYGEYVKDA